MNLNEVHHVDDDLKSKMFTEGWILMDFEKLYDEETKESVIRAVEKADIMTKNPSEIEKAKVTELLMIEMRKNPKFIEAFKVYSTIQHAFGKEGVSN